MAYLYLASPLIALSPLTAMSLPLYLNPMAKGTLMVKFSLNQNLPME